MLTFGYVAWRGFFAFGVLPSVLPTLEATLLFIQIARLLMLFGSIIIALHILSVFNCIAYRALHFKIRSVVRRHRQMRREEFCYFIWQNAVRHKQITSFVLQHNRQYWSRIAFVTISPAILFNLYVVVFIFFKNIPLMEKLFVVAALLSHFALICSIQIPMAFVSNDIHRSAREHFRIQILLGRQSLRLKWKTLSQVEIFHTNKPMGYAAGALGVITKKSLVEFIFVYSMYLLLMIKNIRNGNI